MYLACDGDGCSPALGEGTLQIPTVRANCGPKILGFLGDAFP